MSQRYLAQIQISRDVVYFQQAIPEFVYVPEILCLFYSDAGLFLKTQFPLI